MTEPLNRKEQRKIWEAQMSQAYIIGELWDFARRGRIDDFERAIALDGEVDKKNKFGATPLMYASSAGQVAMVEWLLQHGADVNDRTPAEYHQGGKFTALHEACAAGHEVVARLLLLHKAKVDLKDGEGKTALIHAIEQQHKGIIHLLLGAKANVNVRGRGGWTPLHASISVRRLDIAKLLVEHGGDVGTANKNSHGDLLLTACFDDYEEAVRWLLETGCDANQADKDGDTPLMIAAARGHAGIVANLLSFGANVSAKGSRGWTPLHHAVVGRNPLTVESLLKAGADPFSEGDNPLFKAYPNSLKTWTPREVARRHPNRDVIRLLEEAMNRNTKRNL